MPEQKPFIPFGINPHTPKNNPVNETTLGHVTDPVHWTGSDDEKNSSKRILYKYIPTRTYENNKLKGITYAWVMMTKDEKEEFEKKLTHPQDYYIVLIDKPGKKPLHPFYPEGINPPNNFKETTTTPRGGINFLKKTNTNLPIINFSGTFGGTRHQQKKKNRKTRKR